MSTSRLPKTAHDLLGPLADIENHVGDVIGLTRIDSTPSPADIADASEAWRHASRAWVRLQIDRRVSGLDSPEAHAVVEVGRRHMYDAAYRMKSVWSQEVARLTGHHGEGGSLYETEADLVRRRAEWVTLGPDRIEVMVLELKARGHDG